MKNPKIKIIYQSDANPAFNLVKGQKMAYFILVFARKRKYFLQSDGTNFAK